MEIINTMAIYCIYTNIIVCTSSGYNSWWLVKLYKIY